MSNVTFNEFGDPTGIAVPNAGEVNLGAAAGDLYQVTPDGIAVPLRSASISNFFCNSSFEIDQEGNAGGTPTSGVHAVDQWGWNNSAGAGNLTRTTTVRTGAKSIYSLQLNIAGASYGTVNQFRYSHFLEGVYGQSLIGGFTISAWLMCDVTGVYGFSIRTLDAVTNQSYVAAVPLTAGVWTYFTRTIPAIPGGPVTTNSRMFAIEWSAGMGTNFHTATLDQWQVGTFLFPDTGTPLVTGNFHMSEPMMALASPDFQPNNHSVDLAWAKRYYQEENAIQILAGSNTVGDGGAFQQWLTYKVEMRIGPSTSFADITNSNCTGPTATQISLHGNAVFIIITTGAGQADSIFTIIRSSRL